MRKNVGYLVVAVLLVTVLSGCMAYSVAPVTGFLWTDVKGPMTATSNMTYSKVGTAQCTSILGLVATGDASIETAAKNGGITKIHHVDFHSTNLLGIFATFTVTVYGD
ncbi:TRL-like family protein [bacterium]|nr:TRL-like family protein [candidate division CSSED10-310 bacterium]